MVIRNDGMMFFVAGINYRKCDMEIRGQYALPAKTIEKVLTKAKQCGIPEVFILSTCNRTEIYGLAHAADTLIHLLCEETRGDTTQFKKSAYIHKQAAAAAHLFDVAAGLDSQILGDYEIVGQLKVALKLAKNAGTWGSFLDRLVNAALQASKEIKNQTALSGGTVSVSFAAVQWIRQHTSPVSNKHIVLVGAGKIGRNTCKNLVDYGSADKITILNRTLDHAMDLANAYQVNAGSLDALDQHLDDADIVITATSSTAPFIMAKQFADRKPRLVIDLSVPSNVHKDVEACDWVQVVRVDELSRITDETLSTRTAEIPKARAIINQHLETFREWSERRRHAPMLNDLKTTLFQLQQHPHIRVQLGNCNTNASLRINKVIRDTAKKLDIKDAKGCHFISALNQFIS